MTEEEAKKEIIDMANALQLIPNTPKGKAVSMALKALEKDIPKAPKKSDTPRYGMGYEYYDWYCPTCNKFLAFECDTKRQYIHRCECGQRLDWRK